MSTNFDSLMNTNANLAQLKYEKYEYENRHFNKRHLLHKHAHIGARHEHLNLFEFVLRQIEVTLKLISDKLMNEAATLAPTEEAEKATEGETADAANTTNTTNGNNQKEQDNEKHRHLKGCFRVGHFEKGTLIKFDRCVELIVLTSQVPNYTLVKRILDELQASELFHPKEAETQTTESTTTNGTAHGKPKYDLAKNLKLIRDDDNVLRNESCVYMVYTLSGKDENGADTDEEFKFKLTFSSLEHTKQASDEELAKTPGDFNLSKEICVQAGRKMKHVEWFKRQLKPIANALLIIRLVRDLCKRTPTWAALDEQDGELIDYIVDKCFVRNRFEDLTVKFRTLFELLAGGLLMLNELRVSSRLQSCAAESECELYSFADPIDSDANLLDRLTVQQKEELTASAQHALRLVCLNRVHEILGIDRIEQQQQQHQPSKQANKSDSNEATNAKDAEMEQVNDENDKSAANCDEPINFTEDN